MGDFQDGQFHLIVSLRYIPAPNEEDFLCDLFNRTSALLSVATHGSHRIGRVLYSINSMGGAGLDVLIHPRDDVHPNSTSARLWNPTESLDTSQDYLMWPTALAHELSHYVYNLADEFDSDNKNGCQMDIRTRASLMEYYPRSKYTRWTTRLHREFQQFSEFLPLYSSKRRRVRFKRGQPTQFCHDDNHNRVSLNPQNIRHGRQSCWTYMANDDNHGPDRIPYGLVVPDPGRPRPAPPPAPPEVPCTLLIPVQRFILVLDCSASMTGAKLDQLKIGAGFWVDYVNPPEEFGVVTLPAADVPDIARSELPAAGAALTTWRDDRHRIIDDLRPGGAAAIGDALRAGLNAIVAGGRASSQVMLLVSDGLQNAGSETAEQVLVDLRANGVRVYTVGLGNNNDTALLESIATTTGASYFPIFGDLSPEQAAAAITEAMVQIAGQSRENGGVVAFNEVDDTGAPINGGAPFFGSGDTGGRSVRFPVTISSGSTHATLGAIWRNRRNRVDVRIYDPAGAAVTAEPDVRAVRGQYPYAFYEIDQPLPGIWEVEVIGATALRSIGFEVNPSVRLEATATPHHAALGEAIHLRARLLSPHPVSGANMTAYVYSPAGSWETVKLLEGSEETAAEGLYTATVPTEREPPGQYLIVLDAFTHAREFVIALDPLYAMRARFGAREKAQIVTTPEVHRQAVLSVVTSQSGSTDEAITGANDIAPVIPEDHDAHLTKWLREHPLDPGRARDAGRAVRSLRHDG